MIGEDIGGTQDITKIPVGCVVYSQESEGRTENVTVIQAAFGHNESVVESSVGIDSYFVDEDGESWD